MQAKKIICLCLVFAGAILLAGCDANTNKSDKEAAPQSPSANQQEGVKGGASTQKAVSNEKASTMLITVYQADKEALRLIPESHVVPFDNHPAETAVRLLIAGSTHAEHISAVPAGTEVLGITIQAHIAYVNFNDKLTKVSGSTSELLLVGAIVNTLTQFPEIQKVQILVNSKKIDTLSGHLDISEPVGRMEQLVKSN